ncbi:MAG TPA: hypothetical protein ENN13_00250 [Candidatus Altiarchaeales archaeon]|nr:hypothetical protein [Candidatus Altiarchaeales archaeon]
MENLRKAVLDVLKPHDPDISVLAKRIAGISGIEGVNISVYEIDQKVENVKITVVGEFKDLTEIKEVIMDIGGTMHSLDEVVSGKKFITEVETLHERLLE